MTRRLAICLAVAAALHALILPLLPLPLPQAWTPAPRPVRRPMEIAYLSSFDHHPTPKKPPEAQPPKPETPPEPPTPTGQLVELAPPLEEKIPEKANFVAEQARVVHEETRSERFKINPDILAPRFSDESKLEIQANNVPDLGITKPSDGATVGNNVERFKADRHGRLAATPGRWSATNLPGLNDPVPSSAIQSVLAGAPQNDLLDVRRGEVTQLNTKAFQFASYLNQIRRLVNFYWEQNLDNVGTDVKLVKPRYTTIVNATILPDGRLGGITVAEPSGSEPLDRAITQAFSLAAPFPKPPTGLLDKSGKATLPEMSFTVDLGRATMQYQAIDPRAGVQFPGILKTPR
jgi:TonB family protein